MKKLIQSKIDTLPDYLVHNLWHDMQASLSVAMISIPQAMAYASIVGLNPVYGLFTAIIPPVVYSFFGSSDHVVTGPTNTIALATGAVLISFRGQEIYPEYVFALAVLSGLLQLLLGLLNLGAIIHYISNAVLTGFLMGAACLIILNQSLPLLGLPEAGSSRTPAVIRHILLHSDQINLLTALIGALTIGLLIMLKRLWPHFPSAILLTAVAGLAANGFDLGQQGVILIKDLDQINNLTLRFHFPEIPWNRETIRTLLVGAGAVASLGLIEAGTIAKSISMKSGQKIDLSQEFIGQGIASAVGGFFQSFPATGSLTRSVINYKEGANTQVASAFSGLFVLLALLIFKPWIGYIPLVSLAGVVVVSALHLIDRQQISVTWQGRNTSKIVFLITFLGVLFLPLQHSIYLGTLSSILFFLYQSSKVKIGYLKLNEEDKFVEYSMRHFSGKEAEIRAITIEGDLHFAAAENLAEKLEKLITEEIDVIILRMRRVRLMASTGVIVLERLFKKAKATKTRLILSGLSAKTMAIIQDCGLADEIGSENIYPATNVPYESTRQALSESEKAPE